MSEEEYSKKIGIPEGHRLVAAKASDWKVSKGQDADTYYYDHVDENDNVIAHYIVKDSTSTYPPFGRSITWEKVN